jgi:amino acid transporter
MSMHTRLAEEKKTWVLTTCGSANTQGLIAGGLSGLFWSLCWAYTGQFFIVLSLAEMAAMAPTAGGQYHWVSEFAPREYQKVLSYISGTTLRQTTMQRWR